MDEEEAYPAEMDAKTFLPRQLTHSSPFCIPHLSSQFQFHFHFHFQLPCPFLGTKVSKSSPGLGLSGSGLIAANAITAKWQTLGKQKV